MSSEDTEDTLDLDDVDMAIALLQRDFPAGAVPHVPRVVLRTQLYAVVKNRTRVDMRLARLGSLGRVRTVLLFKGASTDDLAVLDAAEFRAALERLLEAKPTSEPPELDRRFDARVKRARVEPSRAESVLRQFARDVCRLTASEPRISVAALRAALRTSAEPEALSDAELEACAKRLVECGALVAADSQTFFWAIPNGGVFLKALLQGRKELVAVLRRSKFKEVAQKVLEQRPLKTCQLGWQFLLRDGIGSDAVYAVPISGDVLLRAAT
jgi:serine/threonine-protein kinase 19